jgi:hypothetical protein
MLRTLLNSASAGTLLLLEDLDAAFTKSRDPNGRERSLTFSGAPSERILEMQAAPVAEAAVGHQSRARSTLSLAPL